MGFYLGVVRLAEPLEDSILGHDFRIVKEEDDLLKDSLEDHVLVAVLLYFVDEGVLGLGRRRQSRRGKDLICII